MTAKGAHRLNHRQKAQLLFQAGYTRDQIARMDAAEFEKAIHRLDSKARKQPKPKTLPARKPVFVDFASEDQVREWLAIGRTGSEKVYFHGHLALFKDVASKRLLQLNRMSDKATGENPMPATRALEIVQIQVQQAVIAAIEIAHRRGDVAVKQRRPLKGPGFLYIAEKRQRGAEFADSVRDKMVTNPYQLQKLHKRLKQDILQILREPQIRQLFEVGDDIAFHGGEGKVPPIAHIRIWPPGKPKQAIIFDLNVQDLGSLEKPKWKVIMRAKVSKMAKLLKHRGRELARNQKAFEDGYRQSD